MCILTIAAVNPVMYVSFKHRIAVKYSKMSKMVNFTYRDIQENGVQIMFRGVRGLKMVPEVFIDIDDNNKAQEKLIRET